MRCIEEISGPSGDAEFLAATNVLVKTGSVWTLAHHQAGPVHIDPETFEDEKRPQAIN